MSASSSDQMKETSFQSLWQPHAQRISQPDNTCVCSPTVHSALLGLSLRPLWARASVCTREGTLSFPQLLRPLLPSPSPPPVPGKCALYSGDKRIGLKVSRLQTLIYIHTRICLAIKLNTPKEMICTYSEMICRNQKLCSCKNFTLLS